MRYLNKSCLVLAGMAACLGLRFVSGADVTSEIQNDAQLRAMVDEMERTKTLHLNNLDKPYFVEYSSDDTDQFSVAGSMGGILGATRVRLRHPGVQVRVGSYALDNTNSTFSGTPRIGLLPIDDDYQAIRTSLWLASDALYKAATDQLTRKRAALRETSAGDEAADLAAAAPLQLILPIEKLSVDQDRWESEIRRLSGTVRNHPDVMSSQVSLLAIATTYRVVNSEGTVVRMPQNLAQVEIRMSGIAPDGSPVWNHDFVVAPDISGLPDEDGLARAVETVAAQTEALGKAPVADEYAGPVVFSREAAAEMMAVIMTEAARLQRKPLAPPGSNEGAYLDSVWSSHVGSKVSPEWLTIVDDPTRKTFEGHSLLGEYPADDQGVPSRKTVLVDKGTLKAFLLSREPVKTYNASNGHGRLPGAYGSEAAVIGNLFVEAEQTVSEAQLKSELLKKVSTAGLKYGVLIRRLDFPSTANLDELQSIIRQLQKNGYARTLPAPLLAYRVYPDGREELVRGFRFKEFSAKDLRDAVLASDHPYVLNYLNNGSAFDVEGGSQESTTSSVICPSILFESVELDRAQAEGRKPPIVSPPALSAPGQ